MNDDELKLIRDKTVLFCKFVNKKLGYPWYQPTIDLIEKAYIDKNKKVLKVAETEMFSYFKHMSYADQFELNQLIKAQLNIELIDIERKYFERVQKIIRRGTVKTDEEFALLTSVFNLPDESISNSLRIEIEKLLYRSKAPWNFHKT
jgi:hypothetical protein